MATAQISVPAQQVSRDETLHDFDFPQREAAFFYGLFLRGHSAEELRRDIAIEQPIAVIGEHCGIPYHLVDDA